MTDRILVADDDTLLRRMVGDVLEGRGYEVLEASSGLEVMAHVGLAPPDLILLDLHMAGMDGFEVISRLKSEEGTRFLPVVAITGQDGSQDKIRCLELGADDFLAKPVDTTELLARVGSLLRFKHLNDQLISSYNQIGQLGQIAEGLFQAVHPIDRMGQVIVGQYLRESPQAPLHPSRFWVGRARGPHLEGTCYMPSGPRLESLPTAVPLAALQAGMAGASREGTLFWSNGPMAPALGILLCTDGTSRGLAGLQQEDHWFLAAGYGHAVGAYDAQVLRSVALQWYFFERLSDQVRATEEAFFYTMSALARAAELNDCGTGNHIVRVNAQSAFLAEKLGCQSEFVTGISRAAQMHDVGKISIPAAILRKPGPLDEEEWAWIRKHPTLGAEILGDSPKLGMAREIALCHHENWDGTGYPIGLAGDGIPLSARIVKVADVYDALRSERPYKRALSHEEVLNLLRTGDSRLGPRHFDPQVLDVLIRHGGGMAEINQTLSDQQEPWDGRAPSPGNPKAPRPN